MAIKEYLEDEIIPVEVWGADHWSNLLYVESRLCDSDSLALDRKKLRVNGSRHHALDHLWEPWKFSSGTRIQEEGDFTTLITVVGWHDDWDCIIDMAAAGFLKIVNYPTPPMVSLTALGILAAHDVRRHKIQGGTYANYKYNPISPQLLPKDFELTKKVFIEQTISDNKGSGKDVYLTETITAKIEFGVSEWGGTLYPSSKVFGKIDSQGNYEER